MWLGFWWDGVMHMKQWLTNKIGSGDHRVRQRQDISFRKQSTSKVSNTFKNRQKRFENLSKIALNSMAWFGEIDKVHLR